MSEVGRKQMIDTLVAAIPDWPDDFMQHYAVKLVETMPRERLILLLQNDVRYALNRTETETIERAYKSLVG